MHRPVVSAIASSSKKVLLPSSSSRSAAYTCADLKRTLAVGRSLSSSVSGKGKQKQSDDDSGEEKSDVYKYLASGGKPPPRKGARVSLFSNAFSLPNTSAKSAKSESKWVNDAEMDAELQKDDKLQRLLGLLYTRASNADFIPVLQTCEAIKARLGELQAGRSSDKPELQPPRPVYVMLLKALALNGNVDACHQTLEDMVEAGFQPDVVELNWLLKAAVNLDDVEEINNTLQRIEELHEGEETIEDDASLLPASFTRNWTTATYQHLLHHCALTGSIEYALTLLASASQRSIREATKGRSANVFIGDLLDRYTRTGILLLAKARRLPRLMVDLASWMDGGASMRRLDNETWMTILRCCADEGWWPGVSLAWEHAVVRGMLVPDEGLLLLVIQCAARVRKDTFIADALQFYQDRMHADAPGLREWHWMPLFESQCLLHNFHDALRTVSHIAHSTQTILKAEQMLALTRTARSSTGQLLQAYFAFLDVGRDEQAGVSTEVMNALISAANTARVPEIALKLYAARHYVQEGRRKGALPALPIAFRQLDDLSGERDDEDRASAHHLLTELRAAEQQFVLEEPFRTGSALEPNLDTFNNLLHTAINLNSNELGQYIFDCINKHRLRADAKTYEGAIMLAVTQETYEDAFGLLEECKMRRIRPTASSYRALGLRCYRESDERWTTIGREMLEEHGYFPGKELYDALVEGNWVPANAAEQHHPSR